MDVHFIHKNKLSHCVISDLDTVLKKILLLGRIAYFEVRESDVGMETNVLSVY